MENKVLNAMKKAGKPVRPGEVAKMIGEESKAVSKIISSLKNKGKVISPKRCYYSPSDEIDLRNFVSELILIQNCLIRHN